MRHSKESVTDEKYYGLSDHWYIASLSHLWGLEKSFPTPHQPLAEKIGTFSNDDGYDNVD